MAPLAKHALWALKPPGWCCKPVLKSHFSSRATASWAAAPGLFLSGLLWTRWKPWPCPRVYRCRKLPACRSPTSRPTTPSYWAANSSRKSGCWSMASPLAWAWLLCSWPSGWVPKWRAPRARPTNWPNSPPSLICLCAPAKPTTAMPSCKPQEAREQIWL